MQVKERDQKGKARRGFTEAGQGKRLENQPKEGCNRGKPKKAVRESRQREGLDRKAKRGLRGRP